jgi:xylulokinase
MSFLAIDIGSSACKAVAFDASGEILARQSATYQPEFPRPAFAEVAPDRFWQAVCSAATAVAQKLEKPVHALSLSSHGETFIPINAAGDPAGPAILNQDSRATAEAASCEQAIGRRRAFEITGLVSHAMYPLPKILWLQKNHPELFSAAAKFITVIGYILHRLGLPPLVDYSLASRFFAFDIRQRRWSDEILDHFDLNPRLLPDTVPAGTVVGKLSADTASQLGLPAGTPVVLGGHDQPCGALGSGAIAPGMVADSIGTYECLTATSDHPVLTEQALACSLNTYCHVIPDRFATLAFFPSGIMLKWYHDLLFINGFGTCAEDTESDHYSNLELHTKAGPSTLCVTPHLIGTCSPDFNPQARAAIFGLTPATGRADIYQGIIEGIACEFARLSKILSATTGGFDDVFVTGGGSRSRLGLKLRASLSGKSLHSMRCSDSVCLGSAILSSVAVGDYASIAEAVQQMVHETGVIDPDPELASMYKPVAAYYERVREITAGNICRNRKTEDL